MRRAFLVLILTAACASTDSMHRKLSIDLYEATAQRNIIIGPHGYTVHLRNISQEEITIQSIRLDLAGPVDLELEGGMEAIGETIVPGDDRSYPMAVTISPGRGFSTAGRLPDLSSLRVTISCRDEAGSFVVDDTVIIGQHAY